MREVVTGIVIVMIWSTCTAGEPEREAFLRDYKPARPLGEALERGFEFVARQTDEPRPKVSEVSRFRGLFSEFGFAILPLSEKNKNSQDIEIGNVDYDAMLTTNVSGQYAVKMLNMREGNRGPQLSFLCGPLCELQVDLPFAEAARRADVVVESYGDASWLGRPVKALRLALTAQYGQVMVPERNDYYFAPEDGWLCVGYRERSQSVLREEVYRETVYTFPADRSQSAFVPEKVEDFEVDGRKSLRRRTRSSEVTKLTPRTVQGVDFRLSGYGFPEPQGVELTRTTPPWVWLVAAGVAVGVGVVGLRLLRGRGTKGATLPGQLPLEGQS